MTKLLTAGMGQNMLRALIEEVPDDIELVIVPDGESETVGINRAGETDLFFGSMAGITDGLLKAMAGYRLVQLTSAGYDKLNPEIIRNYKLPVANNGGANAVAVAEHAIMLILANLRYLPKHHQLVQSGNWKSLGVEEPAELDGKTVGLFGFGLIGREVAKRLRGWGVRLQYYDLYRQPEAVEKELDVHYVSFDELLASSDILSIHAPLGTSTHKLFNAKTFSAMKRGGILINTSRGGLVDEAALYDALSSGQIAGAGLDVLETEPCSSSPLFALEQVVFTPHTAGNTSEVWRKTARIGLANVRRVLDGERPHYLIPEIRDII